MAEHYTDVFQLAYPDFAAPNWNTDVEGNYRKLDATSAANFFAGFGEIPSATTNIKVAFGAFRKADGTINTSFGGTTSFSLTDEATNYVYLSDTGTLTASTSGYPSANHVRIARVGVSGGVILTIIDDRIFAISMGGHAHWGIGTPTVAAGTGAGTSPTLTLATGKSDQAGMLTVTTGTSPAASATVATVTFGNTFSATPRAVILTPSEVNAAALSGTSQVFADTFNLTTAHWTLKVGAGGLAAATTYRWFYVVVG